MFNDKISQRILAASLGISAILLSVSCFVFATDQTGMANAEDISKLELNADWDTELRGGVGLGIVDGTGYFVVWAQPNKLYKVDLAKASDWYAE
jgi:hypothetical protein